MLTLPKEFSQQISAFAPLFCKKVFDHVKVLFLGSLVTVGRRTVCGVLRNVGLSQEHRFHKYHRVLSRAKWSCLRGSKLLLGMLLDRFIDPSAPLIFGIDETIERRWGAKIKARGRLCCMNIFYFVFRDFAKHFQQEEIFMKFK